jgi:hypothetical protein
MRASKSGMILGKGLPAWARVALLVCFLAVLVRGQAPDVTVDTTHDTLVYKDGDRIHGHVVEQKDGIVVFHSDRFGTLRVPAADAVVIKAEKSPEAVAKTVVAQGIKPPTTVKEAEEEEKEKKEQEKVTIWDRFSPAVLTAKVRAFFGPWHGRVGFSNELVTDTAHRDNIALEGKLARKFTKDTIDLSARYDYDQTNGAVSRDLFKAGGSWRHDFDKKQFTQYRPTVEWNRANVKRGLPVEYVLLQQEIGYGFNVWTRPAQKARLGVSENLFDLWSFVPSGAHGSRGVVSLFEEVELALPWRMTLTQRGVWYPETRSAVGWEDQVELSKKLTETLSLSLRHEIRRNNPDGASQDYTRLKLLLGLDF